MPRYQRRDVLKLAAALPLMNCGTASSQESPKQTGYVIGQPEGAQVGMQVLADGGNAADAIVSAALVSGVVALHSCAIGGYGGHAIIGFPDGKVTAVDFNSPAPAAAREDMFPVDEKGQPTDRSNKIGWLAAGVPGTLAGLQLVLDKFGSWPLSKALAPAIRFANDGFPLNAVSVRMIRTAFAQFTRDPGSAALFLDKGQAPAQGFLFRNPDLGKMLERLAQRNSVESFYRGDIAERIAAGFAKYGGLVTAADLGAYRAREVAPLALAWNGATIHTAPLTAGGLSVLQALTTLKALGWEKSDPADPKTTHARIEALRLAWHDRLSLLGDPEATRVPVERLLSVDYADQSARRIREAVNERTFVKGATDGRTAGGTIHLSAVDKTGLMISLTLTHGEAFGAQVTVEGLGLTLGHGMSRFDARPGHPNAPRPGRKPLHNMCPTIITQNNRPIVALGANGGRRIPNTIFDLLVNLVGRGKSLAAAFASPRMHTIGDTTLDFARGWSDAETEYLRQAGYTVRSGTGANPNAVQRDSVTGAVIAAPM